MSRSASLCSVFLVCSVFASPVLAQDPPFRASLRSSFDLTGVTFADCWSEGNTAMMAHFGQPIVQILDVTDPDAAAQIFTYNVPAPNNGVSAQEVKSANGLMFIALGGPGLDSVQIVDIRVPTAPVLLTNVRIAGYSSPHNIFFADGWLYLCKGSGDGVAIVDLRTYDPDAAPAEITASAGEISGAGSVHDITVTGDRLWLSDISGSVKVYDVSDNGAQIPPLLGSIRGGSVHSMWPTADHAYLVTADESFGGPIRLFEVIDTGTSVSLIQRDSWVSPFTGLNASGNPHNPVVFGDRAYVANNAGGAICLQIDRTSHSFELVASYDTSTIVTSGATGEGCWGIYPFLGHDRVLASDRQTGFHVIDFSALEIAFTAPRPETIPAGSSTNLDVTIDELGSITLDGATVTLHHSVNDGPFQTTAMTSTGGNGWQAAFPTLACGDRLDYYVTADDTLGGEFSRPGQAPAEVYTTYGASSLSTVHFNDFEALSGWTGSNSAGVTSGPFNRGTPIDNRFQPPFDDPDSTGTAALVTEIGIGGSDDVDGGTVSVLSPVMDFSGFDGLISYVRWYFSDDSNSAESEPFVVELSNDAGASWTQVDSVLLSAGGWRRHAFRITDFMVPTSQMQVRFSASDDPNNSTVEAGVDTFHAQKFGCALPLASAVSRNGTNVNTVCYTSLNAPVFGQTWTNEIDHSGHPGATLTQIYVFAGAGTGPILKAGEVLVNLASEKILVDSRAVSAQPNVHANPIPFDPSIAGVFAATQALIWGGAGIEACNAVDIIVGY